MVTLVTVPLPLPPPLLQRARVGEPAPLLRGVGLFWECFLVRNASAAQVAAGEPYEYNDLKDCDNELCAPSGNHHRWNSQSNRSIADLDGDGQASAWTASPSCSACSRRWCESL